MSSSINFCFLCFNRNDTIYIESKCNDGLTIEKKLNCFMPEYINLKANIPKYICNSCTENIDNIYRFKQSAINNITTLNECVDLAGKFAAQNLFIDNILLYKNSGVLQINSLFINTKGLSQNKIELKQEVPQIEKTENEFLNKEAKYESVFIKEEILDENISTVEQIDEEIVVKEEPTEIEDGLVEHNFTEEHDFNNSHEKRETSGKKLPKTSAQRQKEYRQRLKNRKNQTNSKSPKTAGQCQRDYRQRLKAQEKEPSPKNPPKTNAQRVREYRERQKNKRIEANDTSPSKDVLLVREYNQRFQNTRLKNLLPKNGEDVPKTKEIYIFK